MLLEQASKYSNITDIKKYINNCGLSQDQILCIYSIIHNYDFDLNNKPYFKTEYNRFVLHGYAGTGKTAVISTLIKLFPKLRIKVMTFTGKASQVLGKRKVHSETIHRNIYEKVDYDIKTHKYHSASCTELDEKYLRFDKSWCVRYRGNVDLRSEYNLIIIDEYSMTGKLIYSDLSNLKVPILLVGDPAQLQPVGDQPLGILYADYTLTQIFRQQIGSVIAELANDIRTKNMLPSILKKESLVDSYEIKPRILTEVSDEDIREFASDYNSQIICGTNKTRTEINERYRRMIYGSIYSAIPQSDERLIILKNNYNIELNDNGNPVEAVNGMQVIVNKVYSADYGVWYDHNDEEVDIDKIDEICQDYFPDIFNSDPNYNEYVVEELGNFYFILEISVIGSSGVTYCIVPRNCFFTKEFPYKGENLKVYNKYTLIVDYGYCITCHKSQGSEWDNVLVVKESFPREPVEQQQWLYTAVTRASKRLVLYV